MTDYATHQATLDRNDLINALLHAGCTIPDSERLADVVIKAGWRAPEVDAPRSRVKTLHDNSCAKRYGFSFCDCEALFA